MHTSDLYTYSAVRPLAECTVKSSHEQLVRAQEFKLKVAYSTPGSTGRETSVDVTVLRDGQGSRVVNVQLAAMGSSRILKLETQNTDAEKKLALSYSGGDIDYGAIFKFAKTEEDGLHSVDVLASVGRKVESGDRYHNYLYFQKVLISGALSYKVEAALPNHLQNFALTGTNESRLSILLIQYVRTTK